MLLRQTSTWITWVHILHYGLLNWIDLANIENSKIPNLVKMFNKNLSTQFQVYWLNILNKDRFGHSIRNKLSLYFGKTKNEIRFKSYLKLVKIVNQIVTGTGTIFFF